MNENKEHRDTDCQQPQSEPQESAAAQGSSLGRICRRALLVLCSLPLLVLLVLGAGLGLLQTHTGQAFLEKKLNELLADAGLGIHELHGSIPLDFACSLSLADGKGTWLDVQDVSLALDFSDFPDRIFLTLEVKEGHLSRLPDSSEGKEEQTEPLCARALLETITKATKVLPSWIPGVEVRSLSIESLVVQRSLYDQAFARECQKSTEPSGPEAAQDAAPKEALPDEETATALRLALHGRAKILPHATRHWTDPEVFADVSLLLLPLASSQADSPKAGSEPSRTDQNRSADFPVRTVFANTGLDLASCTIALSGTLSSPQLAIEARAGSVQGDNLALQSPALRLVLPSSTLPRLLAGERGQVRLLGNALAQNTPLGLDVVLGMQLSDSKILLSLEPRAASPGLALAGGITTELGSDFSLDTKSAPTNLNQGPTPAAQASSKRLPDLESLLPPLDGQIRLVLENAPLLAHFLPLSLKGHVETQLALSFGDGRQKSTLSLQGRDVSLSNSQKGTGIVGLSSATLAASLDGLDLNVASLAASVEAKNVRTATLNPVSFSLEARGNAQGMAVRSSSSGGVQARLASTLSLSAGQVRLTHLDATIPQHGCGVRLHGETVLNLGETISLKNCSLALLPAGKLDLAAHLASDSLGARARLTNIDTSAWARVVPGLPAGNINAELDVAGSPASPKGKLKVRLQELSLPVKGLPPLSADIDGSLDGKGAAKVAVHLDQSSRDALELERFVCEASVPMLGKNGRLAFSSKAPLRARVDISGSVAKLWLLALQPNRRLTGNFRMHADIDGTLASPTGKAGLSLKDALFTDVEYGILVREITTDINASLAGSLASAKIDFAVDARDGRRKKGSFSLKGSTNLRTVTARASLKEFAPLRRRDIRAVLSANCSVSGSLKAPQISGTLNVDRGRIQLDALRLPSSITTLPLVEGPKEAILAERRQARLAREEKRRPEFQGSLDLTLGVSRFFVTGYGFDSEWKASMRMRCPLARPGLSGQVEAVRGSLDLLNKRFTLDEGTVKFAGGLDPLINVQMTTVANAVETSVVVSGTPAKLNLHLASNPAMPRNDILAYMLFGKPANELSQFELLRLGATAASFAAFGTTGGNGIANLARQVTGLDVVNFSQNNGSAQLELGSYVMDKVYVGVKQDTSENADTTAVIQIELGPRTSATMETGSGNTSAGLKWKLDY